jgi:hypothetical protein
MQGYMTLEYTFKDNSYAELCGDNIKFWQGTGLPDYEGSLAGFELEFPKHFQQLLINKAIKAK